MTELTNPDVFLQMYKKSSAYEHPLVEKDTRFYLRHQNNPLGKGYSIYTFPNKLWTFGTLHIDNGGSDEKDAPLYVSFDSVAFPPLSGPLKGHSLGYQCESENIMPCLRVIGSFREPHHGVKISVRGPFITFVEFCNK